MICVDIGRDARAAVPPHRDPACGRGSPARATGMLRRRDDRCERERERDRRTYMVAGSARLSGYAVSDGASRFHDDARLSPPSIWWFLSTALLSRRLFLFATAPRRPRAGTKNIDGCSAAERDETVRERESRREALFQDYRGLPAFWNRADRLHSRYRACLQFHRAKIAHA